jgi:hypothetical protein
VAFVVCISYCNAETPDASSDIRIPPGTEAIKEGDVTVVVPKGSKSRREPGRIYLESSEEYSARMFEINDARVRKIEERQDRMEREIKELKDMAREREEAAVPAA